MCQNRLPNLRRSGLMVILAVAAMVSLSFAVSCEKSSSGYSGKIEIITIAENPNETKALIYVAEERGLLAANGIRVEFKEYESGVASAGALLKGEVDMTTCAEFVSVGNALQGADVRVIASISRFQNTFIIGRLDKGINSVSDLRGKRIGVARGTSPEFYLGRFLELRGLSIQQVTLVSVAPAQAVEALTVGSVDAVAIIQPYADDIKQKLGDAVTAWPAQGGQLAYFNIVTTAAWTRDHPELIERLLRSLVQAENYIRDHSNEAREIVRVRLDYDDAYINAVWPDYQFSVSLEEALIVAMRDEARWLIRNNLTTAQTMPDLLTYIYMDGLNKIRGEAVTIIR